MTETILAEQSCATAQIADPAPPTSVELVQRYSNGDTSAFDELFRRYHTRIKAACRSRMGDDASAEDMVQETFIKALRSLDKVDESFNFDGWILRIAANTCTDELRRRQRRATRFVEPRAGGEDGPDLLLTIPDPDPSGRPETALEIQRQRQLLWEVAKKLPERQSTALAMRALQGMSYASIARFMGISESAVETLLHRARRRFKEEFLLLEGPHEDEGACATVTRLVNEVGMDKLQAAQRTMVRQHREICSWCQDRLAGKPVEEPQLASR